MDGNKNAQAGIFLKNGGSMDGSRNWHSVL